MKLQTGIELIHIHIDMCIHMCIHTHSYIHIYTCYEDTHTCRCHRARAQSSPRFGSEPLRISPNPFPSPPTSPAVEKDIPTVSSKMNLRL